MSGYYQSSHPDHEKAVTDLQRALMEGNYLVGPNEDDGKFGNRTKTAWERFRDDPNCDPEIRERIIEARRHLVDVLQQDLDQRVENEGARQDEEAYNRITADERTQEMQNWFDLDIRTIIHMSGPESYSPELREEHPVLGLLHCEVDPEQPDYDEMPLPLQRDYGTKPADGEPSRDANPEQPDHDERPLPLQQDGEADAAAGDDESYEALPEDPSGEEFCIQDRAANAGTLKFQRGLIEAGYLPEGEDDGIWGPKTNEAGDQYFRDKGIDRENLRQGDFSGIDNENIREGLEILRSIGPEPGSALDRLYVPQERFEQGPSDNEADNSFCYTTCEVSEAETKVLPSFLRI